MYQSVRGTRDLWGRDKKTQNLMGTILRIQAEYYGYSEIETPIFEYTDVFHRLGETSDVLSKETYSFQDRSGESLTLRPEGTAPVVRAIISNGLTQDLPGKYYYLGPMFRYDRPQKGRYRQLNQFGVELVGVEHYLGCVEIVSIAHDIMKAIKINDQVVLEINSLGDHSCRKKYQQALVEYLERYKADLSEYSIKRLALNPLRILDSKEDCDQSIIVGAPLYNDYLSLESHQHFDQVLNCLTKLGIKFKVNPRLVRGLDYYCHTVFEFTAENLGAQKSVAAGGRYNGLFKAMGGPDLSGVGFAAGIERLLLLTSLQLSTVPKVAFIPLNALAELKCMELAQQVRQCNYIVELIYKGNLSKRLAKATKIEANFAIVIGDDEMTQQAIQIRDLNTGTEHPLPMTQLNDFFKDKVNA